MVTPNGSLKDNYHATSQETEGSPLGNLILSLFLPRDATFIRKIILITLL